ncbi:MAG: HDOD domain-containing protein [Opitutus sp.]
MLSQPTPTLDEVADRALRLPCAPALLPRLMMALDSPDTTADDIADLITVDPGLAASTLRLANSAYFGSSVRAENLSQAVVRLGQQELFRLAALALVSRWETGVGKGEAGDFSRHALCTALAAEALAQSSQLISPQTAYTSGLLCDLGKLALTHTCEDFFPQIRAHAAAKQCVWTDAETTVLGYNNVQVGARLLAAWNFPPLLVAVAEYYLHPMQAPEDALPLIAHLQAAKFIATSFGPGVGEEGFLVELNSDFMLEWGFTPELLEQTMPIVHERASARLKDKLTHGKVAF